MFRSYAQARDAFGVALGGRAWEKDPARKLLWGQVAEVMCLLGDAEGCIDTSRQAERSLSPYEPVLRNPKGAAGLSQDKARAFTAELQRLSEHWAWDASVAAEAQAWMVLIEADALRQDLQRRHRPHLHKLLAASRSKKGKHCIQAASAAIELAWKLLDQASVLEAAGLLAEGVKTSAGVPRGKKRDRVIEGLSKGLRVARILDSKARAKAIRSALARLETKAAVAAELDFAMAPEAAAFKSDLAGARKQLGALAGLCPLRSRPGNILAFVSAYAGVIAYEPESAARLRPLRESLSLSDPYLGSRVLALLGRDDLLAGNFHEAALKLARAAKDLPKHSDTRRMAGLMRANRAQALSAMGQFAQAAKAFAQAADGLQQEWPADAMQAQLGLAHSQTFAGKLDKASQALEMAKALLPRIPKTRHAGLDRARRLNMALLAVKQGGRDKAKALYTRVAEDARQASDVKAGAIALTNLAELANEDARFDHALKYADSALKWLDKRGQPDAAWQALCEKGRALAGLKKRKAAAKALDQAIALVEGLRARIGAEGARRSFAQAKTRLYGAAVGLAVDQGQVDRAFYLSERARGRAFLDILAERRIRLGKAAWQTKLGPARAHMLRALPAPRSFASPAASLAVDGKVDTLEPVDFKPTEGWRSLVSVNPARVRDVRSVLGPKETLLSVFHDGERLLVFALDRKNLRLGKAKVDPDRLASKVNSLMRTVSDPRSRVRKVQKKARALYRLCFDELSLPNGVERLVVVPWGPLHQVPFGVLHDGKGYWVDRYELSTAPSGSALVMLRARKDSARRRQMLVLANPATDLPALPSAEKEAELISRLFAKASRIHRGAQATEQAFKKEAPGKRFLHLASHGNFLRQRPMDSYLALAAPGGGKAELRASEVLELDLSAARLVVLSACHSGELDVQAAEERLGLSRAFLHAGARALVASLWQLSDESALALTRGLYRGVKKGQRPASALTRAQRRVKSQERFAHPFYWAPLSLVGS